VGTFRFDAPSVVLPPASEGEAGRLPVFRGAPFVFNGHVTGFGHDDVEGRVPLFDLTLVGQGTLTLSFDEFFNGRYLTVEERFTFNAASAPVPEPATLLLFGTGAAVVGRRVWRRPRPPLEA
jgi:hypothetical protein